MADRAGHTIEEFMSTRPVWPLERVGVVGVVENAQFTDDAFRDERF
jgi:hypothetical protein